MILRDIKNDIHTCQICKKLVKDDDIASIAFKLSTNEYGDQDIFDEYSEVEVCTKCRNSIFNLIKAGSITVELNL